jgi:hypothetical protein
MTVSFLRVGQIKGLPGLAALVFISFRLSLPFDCAYFAGAANARGWLSPRTRTKITISTASRAKYILDSFSIDVGILIHFFFPVYKHVS